MLEAVQPESVLALDFEGTAVGLLIIAGPDVGVLSWQVDDGPWRSRDPFTQWSDGLHIPWAFMLETELAAGRHRLTLKTTGEKNEESTGYAGRIVSFLVN
jgi:sialidase-1